MTIHSLMPAGQVGRSLPRLEARATIGALVLTA